MHMDFVCSCRVPACLLFEGFPSTHSILQCDAQARSPESLYPGLLLSEAPYLHATTMSVRSFEDVTQDEEAEEVLRELEAPSGSAVLPATQHITQWMQWEHEAAAGRVSYVVRSSEAFNS